MPAENILISLFLVWVFAVLSLALLNEHCITGQGRDREDNQKLQCNGRDVFPRPHYSGIKYCTYYYNFSNNECGSASIFQGHGVFASEGYDNMCGPLSTAEFKYTLIICFCFSKHRCNTSRNVQKMMKNDMMELYDISGYSSVVNDATKKLFECMKKDIDKNIGNSKKARKKDGGLPISVGLLIVIVVGSVLLIGTIVVLIPFLRKWHKARHKKWLEETWEERVRQAAKELNVQNSKEAGEPEKAKYDKKTRAGRKALKTLIESKGGSKESQEKGSKDDLFPMAIGPNEQRPSAEKFSAGAGKGSAEAGGFPERGFGGFGPPVGRGFSNEAQGMGMQ
ncbi:unnamed protein product [Cylicocyclus nassatus]|uniref:Uncharacterized protein n=1 Tax=Cylicocyclus nassatus TaxID=53992 RepID=A0AA36DIP7_CYLNA|nr:unnamed protein product [Cylicocyclus nassatus]